MLASRRSRGKLDALAVAIEAAAARDPYPRLAEFMRRLAAEEADPRGAFHASRSFAKPPFRTLH